MPTLHERGRIRHVRDWGQDQSMRVDKVSVTGQRGIIANLYSYDRNLRREIVSLNRKVSARTVQIARQIVPYDTGRSQKALVAELSDLGLTFTVKYDKSHYDRDGVVYYPPFFELGTKYMAAQPTLRPAFEQASAQYGHELRDSIRAAIRRLG